ncbi:uncharacterized protein LOC117653563 [Thrips palmi]|uniref:Uncharacterized protein LOC117653563 n=1 Tax=Thrips palmi TaxID=161013 RepID=A0A6P9ACM3_THRPL|nr:uncharacterized protein LOC117653563 [Thrips palmi]XP_034255230.1 uncharacterized protein LOC117653563 [Thrips palmi]XP_034255231.1 uncharacterized protein LOC117653563 [Thrips palmi]
MASKDSKDVRPPPLKEVRDLQALLAAQLADGEEVEKFDAKPATALGDNYGSTMLALDIVIRKKSSQAGDGGDATRRHLHTFCKMLPDDPERRAIFSVEVTFFKELEMYTLAVPAMLQLQQDCGVPEEDLVSHLVPQCYGGRVSLSGLPGAAVDEDAAILLEDMRQRGFGTGNRVVGLDLEDAKLVLEKLAVLQALGVALRNKRPQVYADTVQRACRDFQMGGDGTAEFEDSAAKFAACILHNVNKSERARRHHDAVAKVCAESGLGRDEKFPDAREPFATIFHNDLWTNNMLLRRDEAGKPQQVAFIDFQMSRINSPFKDVLFFLFSSVQSEACAAHLDELVALYHASFVRTLAQCGVDTAPFSLAAAWREIDELARSELFHILTMLRWITADPATIRDNPDTFVFMLELGGEAYARKVEHTVCTFAERGWLDA